MKHIVILLVATLYAFHFASAQKVDNIRTEQSGDFIKIKYNILNSKPGEIYRVVVLCSINGGLKTELESISGDAGNNVQGGKTEYWVVWDVLKDVDELKSADFIVRAELLRSATKQDLAVNDNKETTDLWAKKRFNVLLALVGPGPKYGFRLGYMGKWGITTQFLNGKTEKSDADYQAPNSSFYGAAVTKRIINQKNTQLHLLLGVSRTTLVFLDPNSSSKPFVDEIVAGPELGFMMSVSKVTFSFAFSRFDPGQIEKGTDLIGVSPAGYLSMGLGIRF